VLISKQCDIDRVMGNYYTKQEDGTFRLITFNVNSLADVLADVMRQELQVAIMEKTRSLLDSVDLSGKVSEALDNVDVDDIASEAVRDEVTARVENMDISVDVSL
jgi:hypothetical protein